MNNRSSFSTVLVGGVLATVVSGAALANGGSIPYPMPAPMPAVSPHHLYVLGQLGAVKPSSDESRVVVTPIETDTLNQTKNPWRLTGGVGVGYLYTPNCSGGACVISGVSLGADAYYLQAKPQGTVYQFGVPALNNYTYEMPIKSTRVMADLRVFSKTYYHIGIFALAGIGPSWNKISYQEVPVSGIPANTDVDLDSKTKTKFTYQFGGGLFANISRHFAVLVSYQYTNFGTLSTSTNSSNFTLVNPIDVKFKTNSIMAGVQYRT